MKRGLLVAAILVLLVALGSAGVAAAEGQTAPPVASSPAQNSEEQAYSGGGCCGGSDDGWLIEALENADLDQLRAAFGRLDTEPDAKALLATTEATTIRRIVETGKLPEISLEDWRKLERSDNTDKLVRALNGVLRLRRILTT